MKIREQNIILSCDSCSCRAKEAAYWGFILKASKRLSTGDSFENEKRKIGKMKIEERKIILSRDSCSCRAKEAAYWGSVRLIKIKNYQIWAQLLFTFF